ncbi:MAG: hypothetical protein FJ135_01365 [Deltaproteobacteria bacterium]|nr:hypothetical protein [Deltaproteobacteria bacterium]
MTPMSNDYPGKLLEVHEPPCLSLYQPTHRHRPQNQQDPIRFRNLVKALEESLHQKYPKREVKPLLEPFHVLAGDALFWNHTLDGLAVLGGPDMFQVFRLQRPVPELAVVADSFHIKPLVRILQSAERYQVLALNRREINLFEGNRDVLDEIDLAPGVPRTITEALGEELTEPHQTVASYRLGAGATPSRHGHGGRADEIDTDTERFFRVVDRAILEHHSQPSGLPLMLAALAEYHAPFRKLSHNSFLMDTGLEINPDALSLDDLRQEAWQKMEPRYLARLAELVESYQAAQVREMGSDDLAQIALAALAGRVAILLVEADRTVPGRIDPATGEIGEADLSHPEVDDILDDLAEMVLKTRGEVIIVPAERMPTATGAAATYRY